MKLSVMLAVVLILVCGTALYCEVTDTTNPDNLILSGGFVSEEGMVQLIRATSDYNVDARTALYHKYEQNPWIMGGLNVLIPGLGCWFMGDLPGALLTEGIAFFSLSVSIVFFFIPYHLAFPIGMIILNSGWGLQAIIGFIIPFLNPGFYNTRLKMGLGLLSDNRPVFDNGPGFAMGQNRPRQLFELNLVSIRF